MWARVRPMQSRGPSLKGMKRLAGLGTAVPGGACVEALPQLCPSAEAYSASASSQRSCFRISTQSGTHACQRDRKPHTARTGRNSAGLSQTCGLFNSGYRGTTSTVPAGMA